MASRRLLKVTSWPDPLLQERIEDVGFFYDGQHGGWILFCDEAELPTYIELLKHVHLSHKVQAAPGVGQLVRHGRLSAELVVKNGGGPDTCALCGARGVFCRQWIEADDADSLEYPNPERFYLCGQCVQTRMQPHPRMYCAAADRL